MEIVVFIGMLAIAFAIYTGLDMIADAIYLVGDRLRSTRPSRATRREE